MPSRWPLTPYAGLLFENTVVIEALKHRFNRGRQSNLSFFRDMRGLECDLFYETGQGIGAVEIKSGATIASDYFSSLNRVAKRVSHIISKCTSSTAALIVNRAPMVTLFHWVTSVEFLNALKSSKRLADLSKRTR